MAKVRSTSTLLLETKSLSRSFGGLAAVRDVSLRLHRGELHAVIGPNGAGKSTLVNLLSGHLRPSAGAIELDGIDVTGAPCWRMTRHGIGRSFQRTNILPTLTVIENVRLAVQGVGGVPSAKLLQRPSQHLELIEAALAAVERVGLTGAESTVAGCLSHGAQRQLEIAMTLAGRPKVILLDEPMAGMGPEESQRIAALLKGLAREHAILLIEHDMDFVFAVADWMTVMVDGAVLAEGLPESVRADRRVQQAYLGGHA